MDITKSKLPLATAVLAVFAIVGPISTWAIAAERLSTQGQRIERLEEKVENVKATSAKETAELRLQAQQTAQALTYVVETVKEIRTDVKELKRR